MKIGPVFIRNFYFTNEADVTFLPSLMRRKLSSLDKIALTVMEKVYIPEVQEIVFASQKGEVDRLNKIIEQYKESEEVSPAQFSASVHNYPVGFFTLYKKINIPYFALAAGDKTFKNAFIEAAISKYENVMFVYAENDFALACIISKKDGKIKVERTLENVGDFLTILESI